MTFTTFVSFNIKFNFHRVWNGLYIVTERLVNKKQPKPVRINSFHFINIYTLDVYYKVVYFLKMLQTTGCTSLIHSWSTRD